MSEEDQLSDLEHRIHRMVEQEPRPTDLKDAMEYLSPSELPSALLHRRRARRHRHLRGAEPPAPERHAVEEAIHRLEKLGYIEVVEQPGHGDVYRVTPWGKATAVLRTRERERQVRRLGRGGAAWRKAEALAQEMDLDVDRQEIGARFEDLPVEYLDMTVRVRNALDRFGIRTVGELAAMTERDLLELKGIGKRTVGEIHWQLVSVVVSSRLGS